MKTAGLLRRVTALIVAACDPEKIILFGSWAKGQQNRDSDVHILVIGNFTGPGFLLAQELRQLFHSCPVRIDLHVANLQELQAESAKPFSFSQSVLSSCVLIYTRGNASGRQIDL